MITQKSPNNGDSNIFFREALIKSLSLFKEENMLKSGTIIANKYEIIRKIGQGGMSIVYLAMDVVLNKQWALKEIDKTTKEFQSVDTPRVLTEVEMMKNLDHPSLPRIVDIIDSEKALYIIMDYIEGETLATVLNMYGPIKQEEVVKWSLQLCDVLNYLHHQDPPIIYRDMKPANIMLKPEGDVKVIDFGIARKYKPENNEDTVSLGTRGYAAPEQFSGFGQTDQRTDIYNLGVTIYQLLTGKNPSEPPFTIEPITKINPDLSNGLEKIIEKCTQSDPDERYQSAEELSIAIANYRKLDADVIAEHKKKMSNFYKLIIAGMIFVITGMGILAGSYFHDKNTYEGLITSNTVSADKKIENLKKAIELKPNKPEAYEKLMKEYAKEGFDEQEAAKFSEIYNSHQKEITDPADYARLNYVIGKNILLYYNGKTDGSNRNKLITAAPFFEDALKSGISGEPKTISETYKFLADYYNDYVLSTNSLEIKEATNKEYSKILKKSGEVLEKIKQSKNENKTHLSLITASTIQSFISEQRDSIANKKIAKNELIDLENKIFEVAKNASSASEITNQLKQQVLTNHKIVLDEINASYQ